MTDDERKIWELFPEAGQPGILLTKVLHKAPAAWPIITALVQRGVVEHYTANINGGQRLVYRKTGVEA